MREGGGRRRQDTSLQNVKCSHRSIIRTGDTTTWRKWYTGDYARVMDSESGDVLYKPEPNPMIENEQDKNTMGISPLKQIIQSRLIGPIMLS